MSATHSPRVVVVGLGPGGPDLVTAGTIDTIARIPHRFGRTSRHPAVAVLADQGSGRTEFFDDVYETADRIDDVYRAIVERLVVEAGVHGEVLYAVPGSPLVAERTVQMLLADDRVRTEVVAALSFLDLLWVRLGIDPIDAGVRLVDGHRFAVDAAGSVGPLVVCQCDSGFVLSDIKLSIEEWPEESVVVVQRLGLPDEVIVEVPWADLDRVVVADHLTSIYIPSIGVPVAAELVRFDQLVHALRVGCPWDAQQTHESLKRYLLEETYELLEAIDDLSGSPEPSPDAIDAFCEELGDVLFQVVFHSAIAAESGWFTLADVAGGVHEKLHRRHPHVFGDAEFESVEALGASWEASKRVEKGRTSAFDGIPRELPALLYSLAVQKKAATLGVEVAIPKSSRPESIGDTLFTIVGAARVAGIDPEDALRGAARRFRAVAEAVEAAEGVELPVR